MGPFKRIKKKGSSYGLKFAAAPTQSSSVGNDVMYVLKLISDADTECKDKEKNAANQLSKAG